TVVSGDGGAVWGERGQCGEVVPALARNRKSGGVPDGWQETSGAGGRAGMVVGADRGQTGPDIARLGGAGHLGELQRSVEFLRRGRNQLQKKACTPANRIAPTSPDGAP